MPPSAKNIERSNIYNEIKNFGRQLQQLTVKPLPDRRRRLPQAKGLNAIQIRYNTPGATIEKLQKERDRLRQRVLDIEFTRLQRTEPQQNIDVSQARNLLIREQNKITRQKNLRRGNKRFIRQLFNLPYEESERIKIRGTGKPVLRELLRDEQINNKSIEIEPIKLVEDNIDLITDFVLRTIQRENDKIQKKYGDINYNLYVRLAFKKMRDHVTELNGKGDFVSIVFRRNSTPTDIKNKLTSMTNRHYETPDYTISLVNIEIIHNRLPNAGGCSASKKSETIVKSKYEKIKIRTYESKNNNCLIVCLNHSYGVKGNVLQSHIVRRENNLPEGDGIHINKIPELVEYYNKKFDKNKKYIVLNECLQIVMCNFNKVNNEYDDEIYDTDNVVRLYIKDNHYYNFESITYRKCKQCGRQLLTTNDEHKCNVKGISYRNRKIMKKFDTVEVKNIKQDSKIDYDDVVHWDLETFQDVHRHTPYASGYFLYKNYNVHYGKDCMEKTIDEFSRMEGKIINAFNGSGFDYYFLMDSLVDRGMEVYNLILNNGKLMSFSYMDKNKKERLDEEKKKIDDDKTLNDKEKAKKMKIFKDKSEMMINKVFDLYLFVMSGLDKACKDFKIDDEYAKSSFDHHKIKTWEDTEKYRDEVEPYLKKDVMGLKELFEKFNNMIYEKLEINITEYITLSNMGYSIWSSMLKHTIEIPKDMKKYKLIKLATFGGRCYPQQKKWKSKYYDDVVEGRMTYEELLKTDEFIFNADATSLYPASMRGFDLVKVEYPIGASRWSETPEEEFKQGKIGFYEIKYTAPKNIRTPILPKKKRNGNQLLGIEWSLLDGEGVYTSVDIQNAIDVGYKVEFVNECLVYDEKGDVFGDYIDLFYKMKEDSDRNGNSVMKGIAKLMLNGLYGKTLQKAIFNTTKIVNNIFEFNKFVSEYELTEWVVLGDGNKLIVSGETRDKEERITKPCQLGAFVTAYSRKIMINYMKAIDPTLQSMTFTYTDTDSIHILGKDYKKLLELDYIKNKKESSLGYLCSDIDNEGVIVYEKNLAPKSYKYEYIDNLNTTKTDDDSVMKYKGIPKKNLKNEYYEDEKAVVVEFSGLKKLNKKLSKEQREKEIKHFSIINEDRTRTFNKSAWTGMIYENNQWYPKGFEF